MRSQAKFLFGEYRKNIKIKNASKTYQAAKAFGWIEMSLDNRDILVFDDGSYFSINDKNKKLGYGGNIEKVIRI